MSEQSQRRTSPDRCEETQHEEDDFEAEFLADLEGGSEVQTPVFVSSLAFTQHCLDTSVICSRQVILTGQTASVRSMTPPPPLM